LKSFIFAEGTQPPAVSLTHSRKLQESVGGQMCITSQDSIQYL